MTVKQKVCLVVIDGWGKSPEEHGNAIHHAHTPVMDQLEGNNNVYLEASEEFVGVPMGQMGNSEVGHLNIGAGRVVPQDIVRIKNSIADGSFEKNETFLAACKNAKDVSGSRIHLLGLVSDGGVHSHINHLFGVMECVKRAGIDKCYIHFFADGRDTNPKSTDKIKQLGGYGEIATLMGRYYAMDRDKRWERVKIAYDAMTKGLGERSIQKRYDSNETDEFLKPFVLSDEGLIRERDTLIFFNFRSDRMRQIVHTLGEKKEFTPELDVNNLFIACMTQYNAEFNKFAKLLFPPLVMDNVLAEWISKKGYKQMHVAETEKYAHVTFFFNGGREVCFNGEDRFMVPSPKVPTYDKMPEMSASGVADKVIEALESDKYEFVMCNFAPPDMVGHTGVYEAAVIACTVTDECIGRISEVCKRKNICLLVTADHGNAEKMYDERGSPFTAHTMYPVPFANNFGLKMKSPSGRNPALCDVAPTVLDVMGIPIPTEMTGESLLVK